MSGWSFHASLSAARPSLGTPTRPVPSRRQPPVALQVNKDARALEYLRRSWDRQKPGISGSGDAAGSGSQGQGAAAAGGPQQVPAVVARLYAEAERKQVG